ncbi:MAG: hypothetical protein JNM07_01835 [Phycisphaerae bacterium]|nr:hypothetical protein [Phycisphaerae bacterium]
MCPVDPRELNPVAVDGFIIADTPCPKCGYNLKGVRMGQPCPECGTSSSTLSKFEREKWGLSAAERKRVDEHIPPLNEASPWRLRVIGVGAYLMLAGGFVMIAGVFGQERCFDFESQTFTRTARVFALALIAGGIVWWAGMMLALKLPFPANQVGPDELKRWRALYTLNAITQTVWVALGTLVLVMEATNPLPSAMLNLSFVLQAVAMFSSVGVGRLLYELCYVAGDTTLGDRFLRCTVGVNVFICVSFVLSFMSPLFGVLTAGVFIVNVVILFLAIGCMMFFLFSMTRLAGNAWWAIRHGRESEAREGRLISRAEEALVAQQAANFFNPVTEPDAVSNIPAANRKREKPRGKQFYGGS